MKTNVNGKSALIVTYYAGANYGAFWQAYGIGKYFQASGYNVSYLRDKSMEAALLHDGNPYQKNIKKAIQNAIAENFSVVDRKKERYDVAVFGSDEIWNTETAANPQKQQYWGIGIRAKRKIAYAPCAINISTKRLLLKAPALWKLHAISVRDGISQQKIGIFVKKKLPIVLDPAFLVDYSFVTDRLYAKPYLFVYSYHLTKEQQNAIMRFAQKTDLKIAVVGTESDWADYNPACSPLEWVSLFQYAQYTVTTTFHGCVFSILFEKRFALLGNNQKATALLQELGLESRKTAESALEACLLCPLDETRLHTILQKKKRLSVEYLNAAIDSD